jgi:hypothetical protein
LARRRKSQIYMNKGWSSWTWNFILLLVS